MLVTFTCEAYGDITMFGDVAKHLLEMMGHSGTIPSAISAKDVPAILERLKNVVESERDVRVENSSNENEDGEDDTPRVSLANRAFPLIEMLTAATKEDCNVMWYKN